MEPVITFVPRLAWGETVTIDCSLPSVPPRRGTTIRAAVRSLARSGVRLFRATAARFAVQGVMLRGKTGATLMLFAVSLDLGRPHEVPVRLLGSLSDAELRMVELEENTRRKDLTPTELSRNLAALADTAAQVDREEAAAVGFTLVPKTDAAEGGRQPDNCSKLEQLGPREQPGSLRRVSERIGVAPSEIVRARQHVAAVEAHPEVADVPQSTAITYAKAVEAQPELKGQPVAPVVNAYREQRQVARQETSAQKEDRLLAIVGDEEGNIARARLRQGAPPHLRGAIRTTCCPPLS